MLGEILVLIMIIISYKHLVKYELILKFDKCKQLK